MNKQFTVESICPMCKGKRLIQSSTNKPKNRQCRQCYFENRKKSPIGSEWIDKNGYVRVKIDTKNTWVYKHRYIWESQNTKIPKGFVIHHKDGNRLNNSIENLELMPKSLHDSLTGTTRGLEPHKYKKPLHYNQKDFPKDELEKFIAEGLSLRAIARHYGVCHNNIKRNLRDYQIEIPKKETKLKDEPTPYLPMINVSKITKEKILQLIQLGYSQRKMAKYFDVSHTSIQRKYKEFNIEI